MHNLINISEGTSLAIHSLALIAKNAPKRLNVKYLASELSASEAHLAKIFQRLAKAGVVKSQRGPSGGFILDKRFDNASILDILEIIEGKVELTKCPLNRDNCLFENCVFGSAFGRLSRQIYTQMKGLKVKDFYSDNI